jgi:hypothetical protein
VQESAREDKPVVVAPAKAGKSRSRNRRKARWSNVRQVDEIPTARGHLPELYCPGCGGLGSPAGGAARGGGVGQAGAGKNGTWERIVFSLADRGTHRNRGLDSYSLLELGCNLGPLLFRGGPVNEVWTSQFGGSRWSCSNKPFFLFRQPISLFLLSYPTLSLLHRPPSSGSSVLLPLHPNASAHVEMLRGACRLALRNGTFVLTDRTCARIAL